MIPKRRMIADMKRQKRQTISFRLEYRQNQAKSREEHAKKKHEGDWGFYCFHTEPQRKKYLFFPLK
jgi:hypothetical protein